MREERDARERAAESKRPRISHEDACWVMIIP